LAIEENKKEIWKAMANNTENGDLESLYLSFLEVSDQEIYFGY